MLDDRGIERFSRQIVLPEVGVAGQERLLAARVLTADLSSPLVTALAYLAAAGISRFDVIGDRGRVEPSDVAAPPGYGPGDVGTPRLFAVGEILRRANPEASIEETREVEASGSGSATPQRWQLVLSSGDRDRLHRAGRIAHAAHIPLVAADTATAGGWVAGFAGHDRTHPCPDCAMLDGASLRTGATAPEGDIGSEQVDTAVATGLDTGVVGSLAAIEMIKLVLGIGTPLIGTCVRYERSSGALHIIPVRKDPHCPWCQPDGSRPGGRRTSDAREHR